MNNWNEIKSAYQVARLGTLTAAADALNVHRATILRHIDDLEKSVGVKLFHRHSKGYSPTEAGLDLFKVADVTNDQFSQLLHRMKNSSQELSGDLIITSVEGLSDLIMPAVSIFLTRYPKTKVRFLSSEKILKLEYGDAHIAIRGGKKPEDPDNVVQPFLTMAFGLYAHQSYLDRKGPITEDFSGQDFAYFESPHKLKALHAAWVEQHVAADDIKFISNSPKALFSAVLSGSAIGFLPQYYATKNPLLREVIAPRDEWAVNFWLITHGDLHRSGKVQAFLQILKGEAHRAIDLLDLSSIWD